MRVLKVIAMGLLLSACGTDHDVDAQSAMLPTTADRDESYYKLISAAIEGNKGREVALLWRAATLNKLDVVQYLLEKKFTGDYETFRKLSHMLHHHADLWE